jgi:hypothetical protein
LLADAGGERAVFNSLIVTAWLNEVELGYEGERAAHEETRHRCHVAPSTMAAGGL